MAKSYLTPDELVIGNKWLKTVFFPCVNTGHSDYVHPWHIRETADVCKQIYKILVDKVWDTNNSTDAIFKQLAGWDYYNVPIDPNNMSSNTYKIKATDFCKLFANICAKKEIFWDDTTHTPFELDYFKKTMFGDALWNFECFVSQVPTPSPVVKAATATKTSGTSTPRAPRTAGAGTGAGHTLYRNNAGGIVGSSKEILSGNYVYCIIGEFVNPGKTKPRIHVSPQGQNAPLKVKYNSGQGHNDCVLYWATIDDAVDFKAVCDTHVPSNVVNLAVKKMATDPNGYVEVSTEFGPAYIKASKLHEEICEEVETVEVVENPNENVEQLPESHYREEYSKAAEALRELLY